MDDFLKEKLNQSLSYKDYHADMNRLAEEGRTSGLLQSEGRVSTTKLNVQKMNRIEKSMVIVPALEKIITGLKHSYIWLVISEAWCGDSAQNLPVIYDIASRTDRIDLRIIMRDENLDLMDRYSTNGSRSIPKLICINAGNMEVLGTWGPRPKPAQDMIMKNKKDPVLSNDELQKNLQLWYAKDKTLTIQAEFIELLKEWEAKA